MTANSSKYSSCPCRKRWSGYRLGKINESKTIVGLFWLEKHLNGWAA